MPHGAALETLQKFGVRNGTPFSSYLRTLRIVVASTVEKGGPLAPSAEMAIELVRIRTAQQYPMLMPTLFPGDLATREKPYDSLASMWTTIADLKHNTSLAIDGGAFASARQASSLHAPPPVATPATSIAASQRHKSHAVRPAHDVSHISYAHSRRDPFSVDYGFWPFDDRDYAIVCTVTNNMVNTNLSLWTPLLTEDARRQACIQYSGRCCNCGSTEHSLRWCPAPAMNVFSLLNPEFATHDADSSIFETWKEKMRLWRRRGSNRRHQGNGRRPASGNGNPRSHNRGSTSASQDNNGITHATNVAAAPAQPLAPSSAPGPAPIAAPTMRYGSSFTGNQPERSPIRYTSGTTCPYFVTVRRQCHIRTTVYGIIPRMPHGCPTSPPVNTNTQVTCIGPTLRPCHFTHTPDPAASTGIDPPTGTFIQRCGETGTRDTDIRVLCPPRDRPPHGHAAPCTGSSGFSAGLVSLPAIHEPSLDDSNGDADSKVDAHPPCPIQIDVCPPSRQTPDLGTPASQLTAVGPTQDCAATETAAVIPPYFLDAENGFLNRIEDHPH